MLFSNGLQLDLIFVCPTVCLSVCLSINLLRSRVSDLTDALEKKGQDLEQLHRDMEQVERDGLMEVRRLRVQLNSAEQEVNEVSRGAAMNLHTFPSRHFSFHFLKSRQCSSVKRFRFCRGSFQMRKATFRRCSRRPPHQSLDFCKN